MKPKFDQCMYNRSCGITIGGGTGGATWA